MPSVKSLIRYALDPPLFMERLKERQMIAAAKRFYNSQTQQVTDAERQAALGAFGDLISLVEEARSTSTYQQLSTLWQAQDEQLRIAASQTTGPSDCITMYVLIRLWKPEVMVETGVFYGAISAMILHAMERNGFGRLYSIDLPIPQNNLHSDLRGGLVPNSLRKHWSLILGDSRIELPTLLQQLKSIDAFNHDSLHTTRHMTWEYETSWPYIRAGGFLSSHDVLYTPSWDRFQKKYEDQIAFAARVYALSVALKRE